LTGLRRRELPQRDASTNSFRRVTVFHVLRPTLHRSQHCVRDGIDPARRTAQRKVAGAMVIASRDFNDPDVLVMVIALLLAVPIPAWQPAIKLPANKPAITLLCCDEDVLPSSRQDDPATRYHRAQLVLLHVIPGTVAHSIAERNHQRRLV